MSNQLLSKINKLQTQNCVIENYSEPNKIKFSPYFFHSIKTMHIKIVACHYQIQWGQPKQHTRMRKKKKRKQKKKKKITHTSSFSSCSVSFLSFQCKEGRRSSFIIGVGLFSMEKWIHFHLKDSQRERLFGITQCGRLTLT